MDNNIVELVKALKLMQETCESIPSKECDNMREFGNCPIYKSIKEEFNNENK